MTAPLLEIVYRFQALACGLGQDASPVHRYRANALEDAKAEACPFPAGARPYPELPPHCGRDETRDG